MTDDELPFGAWVLRAGSDDLDVDRALDRFGQVYRCPIEPSERSEQMGPGQPCVFVRTDRSKVVGIWAVGEVVAPSLSLPAGTRLLPGEVDLAAGTDAAVARSYAEVELFPLAKPISLDKVRADAVLADSELIRSPDQLDPLVLTPREFQAVEAMDFWIEPPNDDQRAALDQLLAAEDDLLDSL